MMNNDYRTCLADFGLMGIISDSGTDFTSTSMEQDAGTFRWMAPELLLSDQYAMGCSARTKASDIYALGMVIYEVFGIL
jgi:serine/threonine protein kinase